MEIVLDFQFGLKLLDQLTCSALFFSLCITFLIDSML